MKALTVYWRCMTCDERGEGDSQAERHTKRSGHSTITSTVATEDGA